MPCIAQQRIENLQLKNIIRTNLQTLTCPPCLPLSSTDDVVMTWHRSLAYRWTDHRVLQLAGEGQVSGHQWFYKATGAIEENLRTWGAWRIRLSQELGIHIIICSIEFAIYFCDF